MYCYAFKVIREAGTGYYAESEVRLECDLQEHDGGHYDETLRLRWAEEDELPASARPGQQPNVLQTADASVTDGAFGVDLQVRMPFRCHNSTP